MNDKEIYERLLAVGMREPKGLKTGFEKGGGPDWFLDRVPCWPHHAAAIIDAAARDWWLGRAGENDHLAIEIDGHEVVCYVDTHDDRYIRPVAHAPTIREAVLKAVEGEQ
jgi:hypothetical protein